MSLPRATALFEGSPVEYLVGFGICALLVGFIAFILLRYPDFRRDFFAYWHPDAVAKRIREWTDRNKR